MSQGAQCVVMLSVYGPSDSSSCSFETGIQRTSQAADWLLTKRLVSIRDAVWLAVHC